MTIRLGVSFYSGEIDRDEFERMVVDIVKSKLPDVTIYSLAYEDWGLTIRTDAGDIEVEIDWNEIILKESNEPTIIE
jgi:hypothetical protein